MTSPTSTVPPRTAAPTGHDRILLAEGPPAQKRAYERLAVEITRLIATGELKRGERLPSERTMALRFRVSRTAIREAIIALEIRGVVEVRDGAGIYTRGYAPSLIAPEVAPGPFELLRARLAIEPAVCAVAAVAAKDRDLDRIFHALLEMETTVDDKYTNEIADQAFHVAIAEGAGNAVLVQMVRDVWYRARGVMWAKLEEHFHTPALRTASMQDHRCVFDALASRDPRAAKLAMQMHIERVISEFSQAWR